MSVYKIIFSCLISVNLFFGFTCFGQQVSISELESQIETAYQRAYNATVKAYGYDTVRNVQNSAQFSAAVVSSDGVILTAAHATKVGNMYKIMFPDGKIAFARALGRTDVDANPYLPDIAMLKIITPGNWPYVELGGSAKMNPEDPCIGLSYPESLNQPLPYLRFGKVISPLTPYGFIESSSVMELGDSGGPIYDLNGRLLGVNSYCGDGEDLNFEVPIDVFKKYWKLLMEPKNYIELPSSGHEIESSIDTDYSPYQGAVALPAFESEVGGSRSVVQILSVNDQGMLKIQGTIIDFDEKGKKGKTYILSKSSEVGDSITVKYDGKKYQTATVLARDKSTDLVLIRLDVKIGVALNIGKSYNVGSPGRFLYSAVLDSSFRPSVVGSASLNLVPMQTAGYLGIGSKYQDGKIIIAQINRNSPALKSGFLLDDHIVKINGSLLDKPDDLTNTIRSFWPGDTIRIDYFRAGSLLSKSVVLESRPNPNAKHLSFRYVGGASLRREGFSEVFIHDARIRPWECGGPVYDSEHRFCGINIARFSRTATVLLTTAHLTSFLNNLHNNSKR